MMQTVLNIQSFLEYNGIIIAVFALGMFVGLKTVSYIISRKEYK
jgi:hypothetical protein